MQDYNKNNKPVVKATPTASPFHLKSENLAPIVPATGTRPALNILKNSVSSSASAKLQSATRLPGRVTLNGAPRNFE
jgi:hypothetical protein